jgi:hypothetical protein
MRTGIAAGLLNFKESSFKFLGIDSIPSEPKILLKNYLLDLVTESDGKKSSVYLKGVERFIQEIWEEMVRNNWRTLHVRKFAPEKLGVSGIYPYKNGRKAISIQNLYKLLFLWKEYCRKNSREVEKKRDEIYKSDFIFSIHKGSGLTKLPKYLSPKLFYFLGWMCGDGHIEDRWNQYLIKISEKSLDQINYVLKPLFEDLFNINAPIFQIYGRGYALQVGNKAVFRFLTQVLKIKVGAIPELVKNLDPISKKYFLMGVFDSEGTLNSSYLDSEIEIHQSNFNFLKELIDLFRSLHIHFNGPYFHKNEKGVWYHIQIRKKAEILKFIKEIGTCHVDKFQKIKLLEKEIYAHGYRYNST